jgi:hypothetical protein
MAKRTIPDDTIPSARLRLAEEILIEEFMDALSNAETMIEMRARARELGVDCGPLVHRIPSGIDRVVDRVVVPGGGYYNSIRRVERKTIKIDWERIIVCLPVASDPLWDKIEKGESLDV